MRQPEIDRRLKAGSSADELAEIRHLCREVADQQRTIEILKAATRVLPGRPPATVVMVAFVDVAFVVGAPPVQAKGQPRSPVSCPRWVGDFGLIGDGRASDVKCGSPAHRILVMSHTTTATTPMTASGRILPIMANTTPMDIAARGHVETPLPALRAISDGWCAALTCRPGDQRASVAHGWRP